MHLGQKKTDSYNLFLPAASKSHSKNTGAYNVPFLTVGKKQNSLLQFLTQPKWNNYFHISSNSTGVCDYMKKEHSIPIREHTQTLMRMNTHTQREREIGCQRIQPWSTLCGGSELLMFGCTVCMYVTLHY